MLKIIIELHPGGSERNKETLGTMEIWNDGSSYSDSIGNYEYKIHLKTKKSGEVAELIISQERN